MSRILLFAALLFSLCLTQAVYAGTNAESLARKAVSENQAESNAAIAELRQMGPEGLRTLFNIFAEEIKRNGLDSANASNSPEWQRITMALDSVAQQRDSYASGLYWYTDIEQAKAASKASGKPILSLRLLGKLSEEFSCANSRFFRTVLYSNPEIARYLNQNFILH
ncbi:MAG: thioredoxin family protein, partial [Acidobacteria bacterium]|nr:thioredoxin family protein [Acidobacteriota bacterium]